MADMIVTWWSFLLRVVSEGISLQAGVPDEALPQKVPNGQKNYTLHAPNGASVEVHLAKKTYYIKVWPSDADRAAGMNVNGDSRTVTWGKNGIPLGTAHANYVRVSHTLVILEI